MTDELKRKVAALKEKQMKKAAIKCIDELFVKIGVTYYVVDSGEQVVGLESPDFYWSKFNKRNRKVESKIGDEKERDVKEWIFENCSRIAANARFYISFSESKYAINQWLCVENQFNMSIIDGFFEGLNIVEFVLAAQETDRVGCVLEEEYHYEFLCLSK